MAINWLPKRRRAVAAILKNHQPENGGCAVAANDIWPHAREQDPNAAARWEVVPKMGRGRALISTKVSLKGKTWSWHVCVEAEVHCIDVLTGADGEPRESYLDSILNYASEYELRPWDGKPILTK